MSGSVPRVGMQYLRHLLPGGFDRYFTVRKAGAYWGLSIRCPICDEVPPQELKGNRRWRWLAAHQATEHQ